MRLVGDQSYSSEYIGFPTASLNCLDEQPVGAVSGICKGKKHVGFGFICTTGVKCEGKLNQTRAMPIV